MSIPVAIRQLVWERAADCCEYCQMAQEFDPARFEIDHVVPEKMDGATELENLALACFPCNNHKGPNIAGIDPLTGNREFLFNPRNDVWKSHFEWHGPMLEGITPAGRATAKLLQINAPLRVAHRRQLMTEGVFPGL